MPSYSEITDSITNLVFGSRDSNNSQPRRSSLFKRPEDKKAAEVADSVSVLIKPDEQKDDIMKSSKIVDIEDEEKPKESRWQNLTKMRGWKSFFIFTFIASLIPLSPAAILLWMDPSLFPRLNLTDVAQLTQVSRQVVAFSLWATLSWLIYVWSWFFLTILPGLIVFVISVIWGSCSAKVRVKLHFIPALQSRLANVLWLGFSSIAFRAIFIQLYLVQYWVYIFNILMVFTIFSCAFFLQRLAIQSLASDFHRVTYQDRLDTSKRDIAILEKLAKSIKKGGLANLFDDIFDKIDKNEDRSSTSSPSKSDNSASPTKQDRYEDIDGSRDSKLNQIPGDNHSRRSTQSPTTPDEREPKISPVNFVNSLFRKKTKANKIRIGHDGPKRKITDISSDRYARSLGQKLFYALLPRGANEIQLDDFRKYLKTEKMFADATVLFDRHSNGRIGLDDMVFTVKKIWKERRDLEHSVTDLSQALGILDGILTGVSCVFAGLASLQALGIGIESILPFTSIIVAGSFIFGGTAKSTFECIIFLFVTHPFDAGKTYLLGDRIFYDDVNFIVEEMKLLTTVLTMDGKKVYIPNDVLAKKTILNARRSGPMTSYIDVQFHISTPEEKIREIHRLMKEYTSRSKYFRPECSMSFPDLGNQHMITVKFGMPHKQNWQDAKNRFEGHTEYMFQLKSHLQELGIEYILPTQRISFDKDWDAFKNSKGNESNVC